MKCVYSFMKCYCNRVWISDWHSYRESLSMLSLVLVTMRCLDTDHLNILDTLEKCSRLTKCVSFGVQRVRHLAKLNLNECPNICSIH